MVSVILLLNQACAPVWMVTPVKIVQLVALKNVTKMVNATSMVPVPATLGLKDRPVSKHTVRTTVVAKTEVFATTTNVSAAVHGLVHSVKLTLAVLDREPSPKWPVFVIPASPAPPAQK